MAFTTGNFRVVLSTSAIPMTQGVTEIEGEGFTEDGWKIAISVKSSFVDPWPNTEEGGHEVFGGSLQIWKGDELKYTCPQVIQWNIWRDANNNPRRIYAENQNHPVEQDWEIGGPTPNYDNVAYENGEWIYSCFWQASSGVIP